MHNRSESFAPSIFSKKLASQRASCVCGQVNRWSGPRAGAVWWAAPLSRAYAGCTWQLPSPDSSKGRTSDEVLRESRRNDQDGSLERAAHLVEVLQHWQAPQMDLHSNWRMSLA